MTRIVESWGIGRKDYSQGIESSVVPAVISHQLRISWKTTNTITLKPDEYWLIGLLIPALYKNKITSVTNFKTTTRENILLKVRLILMDLDKYVEGSTYEEEWYGAMYGYKIIEFQIDKGITIEPTATSKYYHAYCKTCFALELINPSSTTYDFTFDANVLGQVSVYPE